MRRTLTLLLAAAAALLSFVFRTPPRWQLDAGSPEDVRFLRGFYPPETGNNVIFRWTGPDAQISLAAEPAPFSVVSAPDFPRRLPDPLIG